MKNKLKFSLVLALLAMFFTSCDPGFSYSKKIKNSSNYDVLIIVADTMQQHSFRGYDFDTLEVPKHSEVEIARDGGLGSIVPYENCDYFRDSLITIIIGFDSLHLTVDINDVSTWEYTQINDNSGGVGECVFFIEDRIIK